MSSGPQQSARAYLPVHLEVNASDSEVDVTFLGTEAFVDGSCWVFLFGHTVLPRRL